MIEYNCYGYAINTKEWKHPGEYSGGSPKDANGELLPVDELAEEVLNDLSTLGYDSRIVSLSYTPLENETKIALRIFKNYDYYNNIVLQDYHFMRYYEGSWYQKISKTAIIKRKNEYTITDVWNNEKYFDGFWYEPQSGVIYDSNIKYIVFEDANTLKPSLLLVNNGNDFIKVRVKNNHLTNANLYIQRTGYDYIDLGVVAPGSYVDYTFYGLLSETSYQFKAYAKAESLLSSYIEMKYFNTQSSGGGIINPYKEDPYLLIF